MYGFDTRLNSVGVDHAAAPRHPAPHDRRAQLSLFQHNLMEHRAMFDALADLQPVVESAAAALSACLALGGKIMLCGNGGSAADSQHIAAELTGRFLHDRAPLAAMALSTDTSALTCIANDYSFDEVFARQVRALGRAGDCFIGISTSGHSENILRAARTAKALGMVTIGLTGRDGGLLAPLCDYPVIVPCPTTARIQEAHIFIGHTWCGLIEESVDLRS